jgi:hypothetical protein
MRGGWKMSLAFGLLAFLAGKRNNKIISFKNLNYEHFEIANVSKEHAQNFEILKFFEQKFCKTQI